MSNDSSNVDVAYIAGICSNYEDNLDNELTYMQAAIQLDSDQNEAGNMLKIVKNPTAQNEIGEDNHGECIATAHEINEQSCEIEEAMGEPDIALE